MLLGKGGTYKMWNLFGKQGGISWPWHFLPVSCVYCFHLLKGNSRERSVTVSPHGEDTDTIEQNTSEVDEDDFIFVEDLKNDEEKNEMDNVSLG